MQSCKRAYDVVHRLLLVPVLREALKGVERAEPDRVIGMAEQLDRTSEAIVPLRLLGQPMLQRSVALCSLISATIELMLPS